MKKRQQGFNGQKKVKNIKSCAAKGFWWHNKKDATYAGKPN